MIPARQEDMPDLMQYAPMSETKKRVFDAVSQFSSRTWAPVELKEVFGEKIGAHMRNLSKAVGLVESTPQDVLEGFDDKSRRKPPYIHPSVVSGTSQFCVRENVLGDYAQKGATKTDFDHLQDMMRVLVAYELLKEHGRV